MKTPVFNGEESYNSTDFGRLSTECVLDKEVETFLKVVFPKEDRDEVCLDTPVWMANHPLAAMQPLHYDEPPVTKSALKGKEFTCKSQPGTVVVFPFGGSIIVYPGSHKQQLDSRIVYPCRRVRVQPGCAIFMTIMGHRGDGLFSLNDSAGLPVPKEEYLYTTSTHHWVPRLHLYVARTRKPRDRDITILVPQDVAKQFAHRTDNIEDIATTTFLLEHNMLEQIFGESSMREYGAWVSNRACEIPWQLDPETSGLRRNVFFPFWIAPDEEKELRRASSNAAAAMDDDDDDDKPLSVGKRRRVPERDKDTLKRKKTGLEQTPDVQNVADVSMSVGDNEPIPLPPLHSSKMAGTPTINDVFAQKYAKYETAKAEIEIVYKRDSDKIKEQYEEDVRQARMRFNSMQDECDQKHRKRAEDLRHAVFNDDTNRISDTADRSSSIMQHTRPQHAMDTPTTRQRANNQPVQPAPRPATSQAIIQNRRAAPAAATPSWREQVRFFIMTLEADAAMAEALDQHIVTLPPEIRRKWAGPFVRAIHGLEDQFEAQWLGGWKKFVELMSRVMKTDTPPAAAARSIVIARKTLKKVGMGSYRSIESWMEPLVSTWGRCTPWLWGLACRTTEVTWFDMGPNNMMLPRDMNGMLITRNGMQYLIFRREQHIEVFWDMKSPPMDWSKWAAVHVATNPPTAISHTMLSSSNSTNHVNELF